MASQGTYLQVPLLIPEEVDLPPVLQEGQLGRLEVFRDGQQPPAQLPLHPRRPHVQVLHLLHEAGLLVLEVLDLLPQPADRYLTGLHLRLATLTHVRQLQDPVRQSLEGWGAGLGVKAEGGGYRIPRGIGEACSGV